MNNIIKASIVAIMLLGYSVPAKPMYQPIMESTLSFLQQAAPEIAAAGGALAIAVMNERSDNRMMEPMTELVGQDSQGNQVEIKDVLRDTFFESLENARREISRKRSSGCSQF